LPSEKMTAKGMGKNLWNTLDPFSYLRRILRRRRWRWFGGGWHCFIQTHECSTSQQMFELLHHEHIKSFCLERRMPLVHAVDVLYWLVWWRQHI